MTGLKNIVVVIALCCSFFAVTADGQQPAQAPFQIVPVHPGLIDQGRLYNTINSQVNQILAGVQSLDAQAPNTLDPNMQPQTNRQLLVSWYQGYRFAQMTQPTSVGEISANRISFLEDLNKKCRSQEVHDYLVGDVAFPAMQAIIQGNFHPVVKYNAMLIVGALNAEESIAAATRLPPVPYAPSLALLVQYVQDDTASDALRLGAWVGVLRHITMDFYNTGIQGQLNTTIQGTRTIPPNQKLLIYNQALALVKQSAPASRSLEAHTWFQRRALDVIGWVGFIPPNSDVVPTVSAIVANDQAPLSLRLSAALTLGRLQYRQSGVGLPAGETSLSLGDLAITICKNEFQRVALAELKAKGPASEDSGIGGMGGMDGGMGGAMGGMGGMDGGMGGGAMGGMGGMGGMDGGLFGGGSRLSPKKRREVNYSRQLLVYQLNHVSMGLGNEQVGTAGDRNYKAASGVISAANQNELITAQEIRNRLDEVFEVLKDPVREAENTQKNSRNKDDEKPAVKAIDRDTLIENVREKIQTLETYVAQSRGITPDSPMTDADGDAADTPAALPGTGGE